MTNKKEKEIKELESTETVESESEGETKPAKKDSGKKKKAEKLVNGFYKGYDMRWLKKNPDHADFYLVAECEEKFGEIK